VAESPKPSRLSRALTRLGSSAGAFLLVVIILCGIEVAVDWNATLYEINVLRSTLRDKGEHYADLLRRAGGGAVLSYDWDELERLSNGLFDDEEVVYLRFSDFLGNTIYDRLRPDFAQKFYAEHDKTSFRAWYRPYMARDIGGMLRDPGRLKAKMAGSRYRDFIQTFTDGQEALMAWITRSKVVQHQTPPTVLYQDRLSGRTPGSLDRSLTWALGAVTAEGGESYGVVLVAFSAARLNSNIDKKLWKGLGMVVFFVGLILVQNVLGRRSKKRMQALEAALAAARHATTAALPSPPDTVGEQRLDIGFQQAERLGGTVWDVHQTADYLELFVAVPEGSGVDAAFASLALGSDYRRLATTPATLPERLATVLGAYAQSPLSRKTAILLVRLGSDGSASGLVAGMAPPARLTDGMETPTVVGAALPPMPLLDGPLLPFDLPPSASPLFIFDDGLPADSPRQLRRSDVARRAHKALGSAHPADDVVTWGKKKLGAAMTDDLFLLLLTAQGNGPAVV